MTKPRLRAVTVVSGLALAAVYGLVPVQSASAKPNVQDVQAKVDSLYRQAEQASERYNDAKIELTKLRSEVGSLHADEKRQNGSLRSVRRDVRTALVHQYVGGDLDTVDRVVSAGGPGDFLSQLSTVSSYDRIQRGLLQRYQSNVKALAIRHDATSQRLAEVAAQEKALATDKSEIDEKLADAKDLLGRLQDAQREQILSRGTVRTPADVPVSGRAAAAVHYALAQVGKAYVYGAAGPSAFDCSGLTMMAWAQAGVALPHSSSAQYGMGPHIAESDLQPGDLVFYYSPISHVGMYIGNGLIVNAENPSVGVKIIPVNELPYVGAVRPG